MLLQYHNQKSTSVKAKHDIQKFFVNYDLQVFLEALSQLMRMYKTFSVILFLHNGSEPFWHIWKPFKFRVRHFLQSFAML